MKLQNNSEKFECTFNGGDVFVPQGVFNVDDKIGHHIISVAGRWGYDVKIVTKETPMIEVEQPKEEVVKEVIEEPKEEVVLKPKKIKK